MTEHLETQNGGLEHGLATALQPIRQGVLAQVLFHFLTAGWHKALADSDEATCDGMADHLGLDTSRFRGLMTYLHNEGVVVLGDDDGVRLTRFGEDLATFQPWYELLVGGYGESFRNLPEVLKLAGPYATRDPSWVATGSCGISQFDALPMTRALLSQIPTAVNTVVDIGCGDGTYLVDLCASVPEIQGVGFELEPSIVAAGNAFVAYRGLAERVVVRQAHLATEVPDVDDCQGPLCFITAFVLQELLEQTGRPSVVELIRTTFERYPDAYWVVVEVDHRPLDAEVMSHPLGLAYYNPYYLLHVVTEQRLESLAFWEELFAEAGVKTLAIERPDPKIDSLGLKVGFLLRAESGGVPT